MPDQPTDAATADGPGQESEARTRAATRAEFRARFSDQMTELVAPAPTTPDVRRVDAGVERGGAAGGGVGSAPSLDLSSIEEGAVEQAAAADTTERKRRDDWRLGGRSVRKWRESLLAIALLSLGAGLLAGTLIDLVSDAPLAAASATVLVAAGMLVAVVWAFIRSRPVGLLRFRGVDLLYGIALALLLRLTQGWIEVALGGTGALPSAPAVDLPGGWWLAEALPAVTIAPVLEEFFFRAVVLISVYTVLRRPFGHVVAVLASTALFVAVHAMTMSLSVDAAVSLTLLGLVCASLVVLTGRIWGAVLVHLGFNLTFVALAAVGSALG
ncbi:CPBP family intramembrane glutamic endopeptidase [Microbacterium yannicii]|uniref:CPBP family intramembrane glutamic endopeptidase n=1 Tax=Microbacterium yannicii TaxID=671622 RepID=UPI0002E98423|nr:CPBP family intramembrane glutamic endopeptidase [Microbacterium yannicii]